MTKLFTQLSFSLFLLATVLALVGCNVGPNYESPEVVAPESFRFGTEEALGSTDIAWWSTFNDPVLDTLIEEALENNYDVRTAAARVQEFAARIGINSSQGFPQVTYGADAGRTQISQEIGAGKAGGERVSSFFNANLNVGWELDLWGRIQRATDAAKADTLAAEASRRGVVLTLVTAVAESYVALRALDEQLVIAKQKLATRQETVDLFELQLSKGVISQLELSQIESEFERTAATIPALEREIALLENSLSVLLGRAPGPIERGRGIFALDEPAVPAGLPSDLLLRRPDLQAAEQAMIAANERIGVAVANFYPNVSLTGVLGVSSDQLSNLASSSAGLYQLAAGLSGPIFTGDRLESELEVAEAIEEQTVNAYLQSVLMAFRESEDALVTRTTTQDEAAAQSRQVDALQAYADLAQQRYDNGLVNYIAVLDAERTLFDAQLERVRLEANLQSSIIGIYKAFGGGWVDLATETAVAAANEDNEAQE